MANLIKICGIKNKNTLEILYEAGADMAGFVHFEPSPRHLELCEIKELQDYCRKYAIQKKTQAIELVILCVDPDDDMIEAIAQLKPDYLQLHGQETPARVVEIAQKTNLKIIKALGVSTREDIQKIQSYEKAADMILLDAKPPKEASRPGGLGQSFDWSLLDDVCKKDHLMLSGGLKPSNIKQALAQTGIKNIDVSSGVEIKRGVKENDLIKNFIQKARKAQRS